MIRKILTGFVFFSALLYLQIQSFACNRIIELAAHQKEVYLMSPDTNSVIRFVQNYVRVNLKFQCEFKLLYVSKSLVAEHWLLQQTIDGVPIHGHQCRINIDQNKRISGIYGSLINTGDLFRNISPDALPESLPAFVIQDLNARYGRIRPDFIVSKEWFIQGDSARTCSVFTIWQCDKSLTYFSEEIITDGLKILSYRDLRTFAANHDTICHAFVFNPDPITGSHTTYGPPFFDNNDSTNAELDAARFLIKLDCSDSSGIFYLRNQFCSVEEFDPPVVLPVTSTRDSFLFNRFDDGFEDVNALYHITTFHKYLNSLGFSLAEYAIPVDVHGINGMDNSFFSYTPSPALHFGEGGVDDAEDADVLIHEYAHAISYSAAPATNTGMERSSVDEGFGDYIAASYSRRINTYNWENIFAWDGHNEFWPGRIANTTKTWTNDRSSNTYNNGSIWCAALMDIQDSLGAETADKLIIQAMYSQYAGSSVKASAQMIDEADDLLNGGENHCLIYHILLKRGFMDTVYNSPCKILPVDFSNLDTNLIRLFDSEKFAEGKGPMYMYIPPRLDEVHLELINIAGQILQSWTSREQLIPVSDENNLLPRGIYFLKLTSVQGDKIFKVQKR